MSRADNATNEIATRIAAAFVAACTDELQAPKPGNVHVFADGHGWRVADFLASAQAAAMPIARSGAKVGRRIFDAVAATRTAVSHNTNLGIILLCAPLAAAAERHPTDLRAALRETLAALDIEDATAAFRAIALAAPGGLGTVSRHDVSSPPTIGLREAMEAAAGRDRIAAQYANGFADIFDLGLVTLARWRQRWEDPRLATLTVFFAFLATFPDSHIGRKHGWEAAEAVRREALPWGERLAGAAKLGDVLAGLLAIDADLKRRGLNPGTSADLTVATMFAFRLSAVLSQSQNSG